MPDELNEPQYRAVENLIAQGKILDAIKLYRSYTDCSLLIAKNYVDARMADHNLEPSQLQTGRIEARSDVELTPLEQIEPDNVWAVIEAELYLGRRIAAIKAAREAFGVDLKEARDMVTEHEKLLRETHPERFKTQVGGCAFGGCTLKMSMFLASAGVLGWLIWR